MSGQSIIDGLEEALAYMKGTANQSDCKTHTIPVYTVDEDVDIKSLRQKMGMSQSVFAANFGLSLHTLRVWEQGRRKPDPAARAYLTVIEKAPDTVRAALSNQL